jgi:hypothetical protein
VELLWSKTPVCWRIDFRKGKVIEKSKNQVEEKIICDRNQAPIIILRISKKTQ